MLKQFSEMKATGKLPSPSGVGMAVLKLTQNEDFSTDELTNTIQADPAISGRILKLANSAAAAGVERATTIAEASMRLGVKAVRNVALGFSIVSNHRAGTCPGFDYDRFWAESLARAVAGQMAADEYHLGDASEAYVTGLFSGIGMLALASVHAEAYGAVLAKHDGRKRRQLSELEREAFGIDHWEVASALLDDWGLPETYGQAISWSSRDDVDLDPVPAKTRQLTQALRLAKSIARACVDGEQAHEGHWNEILEMRETLGVSEEEFTAFCDSLPARWTEWGDILQIPTNPVPAFGDMAQRPELEDAVDEEVADVEAGTDRRLRILAVDDDKVSLRVLALHLRKAGHKVLLATDGEQALQMALKEDPQIVISDWEMPGMDGIKLCEALRRYDTGTRIYFIILTANEEEETVVQAFERGVDDYVVKPFKPKILLARVSAGRRVTELQNRVEEDQRRMKEQVAELGILNRKLREASLTDPLTGLPNRRSAMKSMQATWAQAQRDGHPMALIMMDIDHFKKVNDVYGHDAGDEVLRQTAAVFERTRRTNEIACRLGGEEFVIICPNATLEDGAACAERLRAAVEANVVKWGDFDRNVTVSLGVAESGPDMADVEEVLKAADLAVYEAKEDGRNRTCLSRRQTVGS